MKCHTYKKKRKRKKPQFVVFANFCGMNNPHTPSQFQAINLVLLNAEFGSDAYTWLLRVGTSQLQAHYFPYL